MKRSGKEPQKPGIVVLAVLAALVVVGMAIYMQLMNHLLDRDSEVLLDEISNQSKMLVTERISQEKSNLQSMADAVGAFDDIMGAQTMDYLRTEAGRHGEILRIVVSSFTEDRSRSTDGLLVDGSNMEIVNAVRQGEICLSDPQASIVDGEGTVLRMAAPITKNGSFIGYLMVSYTTDSYQKLISQASFGGEGNMYILKQSGEAVIVPMAGDAPVHFALDKTFAENTELMAVDGLDKMAAAIQNGESGFVRYRLPGEGKNYLSYAPLGINDWYVLNTIPAQVITAKSGIVKWLSAYSVLFTFLLVAVFVAFQRKSRCLREQELEQFAYYDSLTGLMRPEKLWEVFDALPQSAGMSCVLINVSRLKSLQNIFGYSAANSVLVRVGDVLRQKAADGLVCHLTTEQFALLLPPQDREALTRTMEQLIDELEMIRVKENDVIYAYQCSFVCGVYILDETENSLQNVIHRLNISVPNDGSAASHFEIFDAAIKQDMAMKESLGGDVMEAMRQRQFVPYYQPRYDLLTGKIVGAELLVRWQHPQYGLLRPASFISVLETEGMSMMLDLYMLDEACKMIKKWTEAELMPVPLSVNISRLNLYKEDFVKQVIEVVEGYGIPPILIELEMTKTALLTDSSKSIYEAMRQLKDYGFLLSMDDFADSYSMLEVMREMSVDIIKIERPFFALGQINKRERLVLESIIALAQKLDIKLVAQRIEKDVEKELLLKLGCTLGQGYLLSEPQPNDEFEQLIFGE